jgi:outer membrane protein OmpA-like peptidoglycan-associated protein
MHRPPSRSLRPWLLGALLALAAPAWAGLWNDQEGGASPVRLGPADFALEGDFEFIPLRPLLFAQQRDSLSERDRLMLDEMAAFIRLVPGVTRVLVKGHADHDTGEPVDADLSQRRATVVRDYLIERGVSARLIHASGFGGALPVDESWTAEGRARNRRVEIYLIRRR